jgi:hypothetical protein
MSSAAAAEPPWQRLSRAEEGRSTATTHAQLCIEITCEYRHSSLSHRTDHVVHTCQVGEEGTCRIAGRQRQEESRSAADTGSEARCGRSGIAESCTCRDSCAGYGGKEAQG